MEKLEKLSQEQETHLEVVKNEWLELCNSCPELNEKESVKLVEWMYKISGLKKPVIVFLDSPIACQIGCEYALKLMHMKENQVGNQVGNQVRSQVRSQVWSQVGNQVGNQVWSQVRSQVWNQVESQVENQVGNQVESQVWNQVESQVWSQVENQVRSQVWSQVGNQVRNQVENMKMEYKTFSWRGSIFDYGWLSFYKAFEDFGIVKHKDFKKFYTMVKKSHIFMMIQLDGLCVVSRFPEHIKRDSDDGSMSSDQVPALKFKDGYEMHYLDGVYFEKETWEKVISKEMSLSEIMKIDISDQRTIALKYNPQAIIKENATLLHKDERNNELYLVENSEINKITNFPKMYFLKMTCPTGRIFIEGVPPDEAEKNPNATDMQALLCGLTRSEYMDMKLES